MDNAGLRACPFVALSTTSNLFLVLVNGIVKNCRLVEDFKFNYFLATVYEHNAVLHPYTLISTILKAVIRTVVSKEKLRKADPHMT